MNILILGAIVLINAFAIALVYQFIKKLPSKEKLIFIAVSLAIHYILITIVYWFSSFGVDKAVVDTAGQFIIYMFVPINTILTIPFIANAYYKLKKDKLPKQKFINRCILMILLGIVILIIEYFYFQSIQTGIAEMMLKK